MNKPNSKEFARFKNDPYGRTTIATLRNALNKSRYSIRVRGRVANKFLMKQHGMKSNHFSRDGSIPLEYAMELVVYVEGIAQPNGAIIHSAIEHKVQQYNDDVIGQWKAEVAKLKTELCRTRLELGTIIQVKATRGVMISNLEDERKRLENKVEGLEEQLEETNSNNYIPKHRVDDRGNHIAGLQDEVALLKGEAIKRSKMLVNSAKATRSLRHELSTMQRVASALNRKNREKIRHINKLKRDVHIARNTLHYVEKLFKGGKGGGL